MNKEDGKSLHIYYLDIMKLIHLFLSIFALYLFWKCNSQFNYMQFFIAICCPYCYIPFALASVCKGIPII